MNFNKKSIVLIIASMGIFVEALDIAIINLALPEIERNLNLPTDVSHRLQSLYIVMYGSFLLLGGKLTDLYGRKKIFLTGALIFLFSSLGAGLSKTFDALLAFRIIQGISAAILMPSAFSIVTYYFKESYERSRAIAVFSSFAAIGSASGLSIGGIITTYLGWQWVFLINVPVLLLILILGSTILEKDTTVKTKFSDFPSAVMIILMMLLLSAVTELLPHFREHLWMVIAGTAAAVILAVLLRKRFSVHSQPLIRPEILAAGAVKKGNLLLFFLGVIFTGYLYIMSFLMQQYFGFSAADSGLIMMPFNVLSVLVARFALPIMAKKISAERIASVGAACMLAGSAAIGFAVSLHSLMLLLLGGILIAGIAMTLCFTGYTVIAMRDVPEEHLGVGSSLTNTTYLLGGGIGLPFVSAFMYSSTDHFSIIPLLFTGTISAVSLMVIGIKTTKDNTIEKNSVR